MRINQGFTAHGRGWVRAVFSRRMRGYALPLGLVRVHLRTVNSAAFARRLREALAGYLVTEPGPVDMVPKVWRESDGRVMLISDNCRTGADSISGMRKGFEDLRYGAALDASDWVASGCCREYLTASGEVCAVMGFVGRE